MALSGLFVTLFDKDTLKLYLNKGIYGMHMRPIYAEVPGRSQHYAALADYGCSREGTHVFFFLKREIIYGGQIIGNKDYGSFYLNGIYSPLGRKANAEVFWDESDRSCYKKTGKEGIFIRPEIDENEVCQPYIILFKDNLGFKGNAISSDQLYFELGKFPFPLPTNSISGMGFCTMTPGETRIALDLIENSCKKKYEYSEVESIHIKNCRTIYQPNFDVKNLMECQTESHLEASVVSNPSLLPHELQPKEEATICRQIPISPFKPYQMDRADVCYYYEDEAIRDGAIPNVIIELKTHPAGKSECEQVERYIEWLNKAVGEAAKSIMVYLLAPSFKKTAKISRNLMSQIELIEYGI